MNNIMMQPLWIDRNTNRANKQIINDLAVSPSKGQASQCSMVQGISWSKRGDPRELWQLSKNKLSKSWHSLIY